MTQYRYLLFILIGVAIASNIITWLCIVAYAPLGAQSVPIHYNVISGYDELGGRMDLLQIPLFGILVLLVNATIAWLFRHAGRFVVLMAFVAACLVQVVLLVGSVLLLIQT
ncbi:MAG: hypothetical protein KBD66_00405 [Candidatus Doudnabacteria bacterium]|nr:hypothetical protein [Candidatus Doudnabacteria bacterium]